MTPVRGHRAEGGGNLAAGGRAVVAHGAASVACRRSCGNPDAPCGGGPKRRQPAAARRDAGRLWERSSPPLVRNPARGPWPSPRRATTRRPRSAPQTPAGGHRRRRLRRARTRRARSPGAGASHAGRPAQPPPLPAAALPGRDGRRSRPADIAAPIRSILRRQANVAVLLAEVDGRRSRGPTRRCLATASSPTTR